MVKKLSISSLSFSISVLKSVFISTSIFSVLISNSRSFALNKILSLFNSIIPIPKLSFNLSASIFALTKHIKVFFITLDEDETLSFTRPAKKGRAICEVDTDLVMKGHFLIRKSGFLSAISFWDSFAIAVIAFVIAILWLMVLGFWCVEFVAGRLSIKMWRKNHI